MQHRYRERGLKLNKKKIGFKLSKVAYMVHILGAEGLQADPEKITAIRDHVLAKNDRRLNKSSANVSNQTANKTCTP